MMKMKMLLLLGLCCSDQTEGREHHSVCDVSPALVLSGVVGASELAFIKEPIDVIAVRDRPLMLDCQVEGEGPISITWRRNSVPVATGVRATVLGNGTLLIRNFSKRRESNETDAGEYDCAAQNRYGMLISRKARVLLASLPKFLSHPESVAVDEGGVARVTCQVNGIPEANITWQRDRLPLSTEDPRYTLLPNGVLQITGVRRTDSGLFRCVASNIANTRYSHEAQLSVTVAGFRIYREPVILSGPQNLTINVHQTAILECIATGNPRPIVSWSRLDGRSIGVEGIQVLGTGNLMISDATLQHSGVYVCSANRPGSRSRRTALGRLVVQVPSSPSFFTKVLNQTAMQVYWELPSKPGTLEGFRLEYHGVSNPGVQGQETFPGHINTHTISHLEPAAVYEIQLVAFNGNGDGLANRRLVSLAEGRNTAAAGQTCNCDQSDGSTSTMLVGIHSGLACVLCCLLFILLGYRRSLFCRKEVSWEAPPTLNAVRGAKGHTPESIELSQRCDSTPPPVMVMVEPTPPIQPGNTG
ncbi:protogenin A-like [Morone saxatilis]|uniref:protogenin A-like n=1 Tax=Morone saxatilis TaxID=34816 RepID=UPI0015E1D553|nr:protogenin A-like [Morone saxatilis]